MTIQATPSVQIFLFGQLVTIYFKISPARPRFEPRTSSLRSGAAIDLTHRAIRTHPQNLKTKLDCNPLEKKLSPDVQDSPDLISENHKIHSEITQVRTGFLSRFSTKFKGKVCQNQYRSLLIGSDWVVTRYKMVIPELNVLDISKMRIWILLFTRSGT